MTRYKQYQDWYGVTVIKSSSAIYIAVSTIVIIVLVVLCGSLLTKCVGPQPVYKSHLSQAELKYAKIFKDNGSPRPVEMAIAVNKTKRPKLMTALAIRESNGNPKAVGDGGQAKGAFQVWSKHHGPVPNTATEQALQAERILEELIGDEPRGSLRRALAKYNGGSRPPAVSYKRAKVILKMAKEI